MFNILFESIVGEPSARLKSPSQKAVAKWKGKKRSHDLPLISETFLIEARTEVLSIVFETTMDEQEGDDCNCTLACPSSIIV